MLKKAKLYSLLAVIVASTVIGLIGSSGTVEAQSALTWYQDNAVDEDIVSNSVFYTAMQCLDEAAREEFDFSVDNIDDKGVIVGWLSNTYSVGYTADPEDGGDGDGKFSCAEVAPQIQAALGGNNIEVMCKLGFRPYSTEHEVFYSNDQGEDNGGNDYKNHSGVSEQGCINLKDIVATRKHVSSTSCPFLDSCKNYTFDSYAIPNSDWDSVGRTAAIALFTNARQNKVQDSASASPASYSGAENYGLGFIHRYYMYMDALSQCGSATQYADSLDNSANEESSVNVPYVIDNTGTIKPVVFVVANLDTKINVGKILEPSDGVLSCEEIRNIVADTNFQTYSNAYSNWLKGGGGTTGACTSSPDNSECPPGDDNESSCRVDGIGWIVCPVVNFMARMVDGSYDLLDNTLLRAAPLPLGGGEDNSLYTSWKLMRDFANVAFVIAFLIVVFSQITSFGVSNYGIKRLLPKLIVAAILVNASYLICAIAVDISNILGSSLKSFLDGVASDVEITPPEGWQRGVSDGSGFAGFTGWAVIATGILASTALAGGGLAILALLIPLLFGALGAVVAVVITLIIRQVLIILLIVMAPLAFVSLLLPNTEDYFKKWRTIFQSLLLLYPVIALVFGASSLASVIIMGAAQSTNETAQTAMQLAGAAASIIPLFIVPAVIKVAGGVLNRFAGIVNNPNKGPIDWARNRSMKGVENAKKKQATGALSNPPKSKWRMPGELVSGRSRHRRDARSKQYESNIESDLTFAAAKFNATEAVAAGSKSGADAQTLKRAARAESTLDKLDHQEVEDAMVLLKTQSQEHGVKDPIVHIVEEFRKANTAGNSVQARAAAKLLTTMGTPGNEKLDEAIQDIQSQGGFHESVDSHLRSSLVGSKLTNAAREKWALAKDADKKKDLKSYYNDGTTFNSLTPQELASQKDYVIKEAQNHISDTSASRALDLDGKNNVSLSANTRAILEARKNQQGGTTAPTGGATTSSAQPTNTTTAGPASTTTAQQSNPPGTPQATQTASQAGSGTSSTTPQPTATSQQQPATTTPQQPNPAASPPSTRSFTPEQIKAMAPNDVQAAVQASGGIQSMHNGDVISIASAHPSHPVGQEAKEEVVRRGLSSKTYRDQPTATPAATPPAINITRDIVDPITGAIAKQAQTGAEIAKQIHDLSGASGPMSKQSLRTGLSTITNENLNEIITHASANAASDSQYQGILDIAQKEAAQRSRQVPITPPAPGMRSDDV